MLKCFTLRDSSGNVWSIPAEDVPTRFTGHFFKVHKALHLDDSRWVVTHCATCAAVARGDSRKEAVDKAQCLLACCSIEDLDNAITQCLVNREELIVREYRRVGMHVPNATRNDEATSLSGRAGATALSPAAACAVGVPAR